MISARHKLDSSQSLESSNLVENMQGKENKMDVRIQRAVGVVGHRTNDKVQSKFLPDQDVQSICGDLSSTIPPFARNEREYNL